MRFWRKTDSITGLQAKIYGLANRILIILCLAVFVLAALACSRSGNDSVSGVDFFKPLSLPDTEGQTMSLSDYTGKIIVLEFFATWCEPCKLTAPVLQKLSEQYKDQGVAIIAISLDEGADVPAKLKKFREQYKISYRIAFGNKDVKKKYNAFVLPTTLIFDRNGVVAVKHQGITRNYSQKLAGEIEKLIRKK
jgi:cytochrome c biogenesis protein CcmG, thiol:disulfide interchange protein DsbE